MEDLLSGEWTDAKPLSPDSLTQIIDTWSELSFENKLGVFTSVLGISKLDRQDYGQILTWLLRCLKYDEDNGIRTFYPLADNWVRGLPIFNNIPKESAIFQARNFIANKFQAVNFGFRTEDHIFFHCSTKGFYKGKLTKAPPGKTVGHFSNPFPKAKPDSNPNKLKSSEHTVAPSSSKLNKANNISDLNNNAAKGRSRASSISDIASRLPLSIHAFGGRSYEPFQSFTQPKPKVAIIDQTEGTELLLTLAEEKRQAAIKSQKDASEQRKLERKQEMELTRRCKENDRDIKDQASMARSVSRHSRMSASPPRSRSRGLSKSRRSVRPRARSVSLASRLSLSKAQNDYSSDIKHLLKSESTSAGPIARARSTYDPDAGSCRGRSLRREPRFLSRSQSAYAPEYHDSDATIHSKSFKVFSIEANPEISPSPAKRKGSKGARTRPSSPVHLFENNNEKLKYLHSLMATSSLLTPNDLKFIQRCLKGEYVKPSNLISDVYPVLLHEAVLPKGSQGNDTQVYFEAHFIPTRMCTWDLKTYSLPSAQ
ncbi:hypothetical protein DSO57_1010080 [Entomophthora muscae]|uniref:Uncharacterized protein n=1 Tax=Entomophthora muscae TaxID=34485 RepID=A0ACC2T6M8_9FUNG|nr:hypothetical protein DSO57_1010080 [Entomophthora muscae]